MRDLDKSGYGYQQTKVWLGPSLGWTMEHVQPAVTITDPGTYVVKPGDSLILVDCVGLVTIQLPDVRLWVQQPGYQPATAFKRSICVKDIGGNAENFDIVVTPFDTQRIDDIQQSMLISTAFALVNLVPLIDLTGWTVQSNAGGGGNGGGGGDVFKAGNNTFTGINTFLNTITVPTMPAADNSTNAASTAFVKAQGYLVTTDLSPYAKIASPTFTGNPLAPTPPPGDNDTSIATTAFVQNAVSGYQPLDADLTALSAVTGMNDIYYRSGTSVWSPVVIGANLTFSGGILSAAAAGSVSQIGFRAHKNGVAQTGIATLTDTKVTFGTEEYDLGSYYNTANSRWTPPAGLVHINAHIFTTSVSFGNYYELSIKKNGSLLKTASNSAATSAGDGVQVNIDDNANGTDYYEVFVYLATASSASISGVAAYSYFEGHVTGGPQGPIGPQGPAGGGGAPTTAEYITSSPDAGLSAERVLTNTPSITWDFSVGGQAKANVIAVGVPVASSSGNAGLVTQAGAVVTGAIAKWIDNNIIEGVPIADLGIPPINAEYITASANASLTAERVLTNTASITWDFSTPGQAKASTAAGGGNVSNSGTPTAGQYGKWVTATTIQGVSPATVLSDIGAQPAGSYQPLDADLTAIAALAGTNTIYYRSAADTWSAVTVSTGLSFSGGVLTCTVSTAGSQPLDATLTALAGFNTNGLLTQTAADTFAGRTLTGPAAGITVTNGNGVAGNPTLALANDLAALEALAGTNNIYYRNGVDSWAAVTIGGNMTFSGGTLNSVAGGTGNVSNSGTPTAGQIAQWTDATHIQGLEPPFGPPQGRLTLAATTPVMISSVAGATAMRYVPYMGDKIPLFDGTRMVMTTFVERSTALTDTTKNPAAIGASKVNDWFMWSDGGTLLLSHGPDWTSDTVRSAGTALTMVYGIWLNDVAITNGPAARRGTYVGTTRSGSANTLAWIPPAAGTAGFLGVWNAYNRVLAGGQCTEITASWTYGSTTYRQMNGSITNQISYVVGLEEDSMRASAALLATNDASGNRGIVGLGFDSTTVASGFIVDVHSVAIQNAASYTELVQSPGLGFHTIAALEACTTEVTITFSGALAAAPARKRAGMTLSLLM